MKKMANNSSTEVLRVSILSLDGVQCSTSDNGVSEAAAAQQKVNISACVGFRTTTLSLSFGVASSSQYTTLFDNDSSYDNILAVYSDELVVPCDRSTNVELQWNNKQKLNGDAPTHDAIEQQNDTIHSQSISEEIVPHLEIELSSSSISNVQSSGSVDDVLELHICVMCTSDENQVCTDNEDDSVDYEQYRQDIQPQMCYGIAYLTLTPPEEAVGTRTSSSSATRRQVDKVIRRSEEVVSLPIKKRAPPSSNNTNTQSTNDILQLSNNAILSVRVERRSISNHQLRQREQYHYIESKWRRDCSAPDSIIHHDSYNNNKVKNDKELGNNNGGLLSLFRRATSTLTTPRNEKKERMNQHSMVGKVITVEIESESGMESTLNRYQINNELSSKKISSQKKTSAIDEQDIPSQTLSERFLCGATIPIISLKDALKMAANAGHHCDEDHVGLYVVDSDDSLGTSIAT